MATYGKPKSNHRLKKAFAKATIYGLMLFASYQYYTPDRLKDAVGHKVEQTTGSHRLGWVFGSQKEPFSPATPAQQYTPVPQGPVQVQPPKPAGS